jgi:hypothetical protein
MVDWCAIVGPGFFGSAPFSRTDLWHAKDESLLRWFVQTEYQTVLAGRPLVYVLWSQGEIVSYFGGDHRNFAASLAFLRARCRAEGIGDPYVVIMAGQARTSAEIMLEVGADAISNYIPDMGPPPVGAVPWRVLDERTRVFWTTLAAQGVDCIPIATTGADTRARREHTESYASHQFDGDPPGYFVLPTPAQLTTHLAEAEKFIEVHPAACKSKALLIYSWDECDEGGQPLMPTMARASDKPLISTLRKTNKTGTAN